MVPDPSDGTTTWIVVPTYNERENLAPITKAILEAVPAVRILVVDDGSPDGTGAIADELAAAEPRIEVLHRTAKEGLGAAYRAGFRHVLADPQAAAVVQMDCDFSHSPAQVPGLLAPILEGSADLVLGSRYVRGGTTPGWGLGRRLLSRGGGHYARLVLGVPYRDLTGGFKAWSRAALAAIDLEAPEFANGYGFQIEMTWRAHRNGARIIERPITFGERVAGASKMSAGIAREALVMVLRMRLTAGRLDDGDRAPHVARRS
jgi:dolichol-phosphate mannosyltransferase